MMCNFTYAVKNISFWTFFYYCKGREEDQQDKKISFEIINSSNYSEKMANFFFHHWKGNAMCNKWKVNSFVA